MWKIVLIYQLPTEFEGCTLDQQCLGGAQALVFCKATQVISMYTQQPLL